MSKFNELVTKLREVFQIDRPELDFGLYRIINARADEINEYLEKRLKEKVEQALTLGNAANIEQLKDDLKKAEQSASDAGFDPAESPKVKALTAKITQASIGSSDHENAVFSHLLTFFSRYYDNGDFISQRRYKGDTYAIPYAGEEVLLHWANKDQYYIKSGENFSNYSFKLEDGRVVHFRLVAADTAKDNRKDNDKERRFVLAENRIITCFDDEGHEYNDEIVPVEEITKNDIEGNETKELIIRFEYKAMPKGSKQDKFVEVAAESIFADSTVVSSWLDLSKREPTEKNPKRTLLEKHLTNYTTKNTADYFIHKNLGKFLRGELDFYIKNEVMHLDDLQNAEAFSDIEKKLRMIQCLRIIAMDLIKFVAQLEDFQKKLWTKKKFVVNTDYCVTINQLSLETIKEILKSSAQINEWRTLFGIHITNSEDAAAIFKNHPRLPVDTRNIDLSTKWRIVSEISDESLHKGVLLHSDNFHALNILSEKYSEKVKVTYIDPPYNTGGNDFLYKDNYKHSTWSSFMIDRLALAHRLLRNDGALFGSIDDNESVNFERILSQVFGEDNKQLPFYIQVRFANKTLSEDSAYQKVIEQVLLYRKSDKFVPIRESEPYTIEKFCWEIIETGSFETIEVGGKRVDIFKPGSYEINKIEPNNTGLKETWATGSLARQKGSSGEFFELNLGPRKQLDGLSCLYKVYGIGEDGLGYRYFTGPKKESATKGKFYSGIPLQTLELLEQGQASKDKPIPSYFDFSGDFGNCRLEGKVDIAGGKKPEKLIKKLLDTGSKDEGDIVLDFFAGSGTTASVALKTGRKFISVESSDYFESKVLVRMKNTLFGISGGVEDTHKGGVIKFSKLESYEDALNNLEIKKPKLDLFDNNPELKDDYLLNYMLDVESRGSLLSTDDFKKPFDYTMKITVDSAGAFEEQKVDLVETFNYLIGLTVKHINAQPERGFVTVSGTLPSGETCLVLWRDCDKFDYDGLNKLCVTLALNPTDKEFDVVYINGDHNIPTVLTQTAKEGGETRVLKLRQIEPEFLERMFAEEEI